MDQIVVTHGGETRYANQENWIAVCDALIERHGQGIPSVRWMTPEEIAAIAPPAPVVPDGVRAVVEAPAVAEPPVEVGNSLPPIEPGKLDVVGAARSMVDLEAATAAGFAPAKPLFVRGARVNETGVENARRLRSEFEQMPVVADACLDFSRQIAAEHREDVTTRAADVSMKETGEIMLCHPTEPTRTALIDERAFPSLVTALGMPAGAGQYLREVWPALRAENVSAWTSRLAQTEEAAEKAAADAGEEAPERSTLVLRTRNGSGPRSVYGVVSERYAAFDVDRVADAIALATPGGARGTVTYDGYRARFEVLFHSTVRPEEYVAGEFFRAGVVIRTDDTGGGCLTVSAVVWQNLCLNLIVIDRNEAETCRLRHVGDVTKLANAMRKGFAGALGKIDHFVKAWGYACREDMREYLPAEKRGMRIEDAIPGFFNGIVERELVPVRGKRPEVVKHLVEAWEHDQSSATVHHGGLTRAGLANAFTRYAHTQPMATPWVEDEIQRAAGAFVQSRSPVPYLPLPR